jgi:hypothetical protein
MSAQCVQCQRNVYNVSCVNSALASRACKVVGTVRVIAACVGMRRTWVGAATEMVVDVCDYIYVYGDDAPP